jgi:hypothetical protein
MSRRTTALAVSLSLWLCLAAGCAPRGGATITVSPAHQAERQSRGLTPDAVGTIDRSDADTIYLTTPRGIETIPRREIVAIKHPDEGAGAIAAGGAVVGIAAGVVGWIIIDCESFNKRCFNTGLLGWTGILGGAYLVVLSGQFYFKEKRAGDRSRRAATPGGRAILTPAAIPGPDGEPPAPGAALLLTF